MTISTKRASSGAESITVRARSPILDLSNGVVQRTEFDGTVTLFFAALSFSLEDILDIILADAPTFFKPGAIEDPTQLVPSFTFDRDTPLSALQELAQIVDLELGIRRDGDGTFFVDMQSSLGDFETYGEILSTVIGDTFNAASAPTTNFGTGPTTKLQRGPGSTDGNTYIKFDLRWLVGLAVRITDARILWTSVGGGSGTSHRLAMFALRKEFEELQATWNNRLTSTAWTTPGARAGNDDRDNSFEWRTTLPDQTADTEISFDGLNVLETSTLEAWLNTIVDGTEAFFGDGIARFVFDVDSGQAGKNSFFGLRETTLARQRPRLLLTLEQDLPRFVFRRNINGIDRIDDDSEITTRVYPVGGGGEQTGLRATIGKARWTIATVPTGSTFTLVETAIDEDDQLVGLFVDEVPALTPPLPAANEITDSIAGTQTFTTSGAHGLTPGDLIAFRRDATAAELVFIDSPAGVANFGIVNRVVEQDDIPDVDNLAPNAAMKNFSSGSPGLPDGWVLAGGGTPPTPSQNTDPLFTIVGGSSAKITSTPIAGQGIKSDPITFEPTDINPFATTFIQIFVETGGVELFLEHSTEGRFPEEGAEDQANTFKTGVFVQITIEGKEFPAGTIEVNIVSTEPGTTFYVDAVQLTNSGFEAPFFDGRGAVLLWTRGLDHLAVFKEPKITHRLPGAIDLTGSDPADFPYDGVLLGGRVIVDDERLGISNLEARVLRLRQDILQSAVLQMELSNTRDTLIDKLTNRARRDRVVEPPQVKQPSIKKFEAYVDDGGELVIWVVAGRGCASYKFLVDDAATPPSYGDTVATGTASNNIRGQRTPTNVLVASGEEKAVRVVAFGLFGGGGRAGDTEIRTVSQPPPIGSALRSRAFLTADLSIPNASISVKEEFAEEDVDIGNLHSLTAPNNARMTMVNARGMWIPLLQVAWNTAGASLGNRSLALVREGNLAATNAFTLNRPTPGGQSTDQLFQLFFFPNSGAFWRGNIFQDSGVTKLARAAETFFSLLRIPIGQTQPRVEVGGSATPQSFPTATDTEVIWLSPPNEEEGGTWFSVSDPERVTVPTGAGGPLLLCGVALAILTGATLDGLVAARIKKNGTTIIGRHEIRDVLISAGGIGSYVRPVLALDLSAVATDFYSYEMRHELGAGPTINRGSGGNFQAIRLQGGTNPRAQVSISGTVLIATATPTAFPWTTEDVDVGGMVDIAGDPTKITATFTGIMLLIAQTRWPSNTTGTRKLFFRKNGDDTLIDPPWIVEDTAPAAGEIVMQLVAWVDVVVGDEIELIVEQTSGVGLSVQTADTFLQAIRVADS